MDKTNELKAALIAGAATKRTTGETRRLKFSDVVSIQGIGKSVSRKISDLADGCPDELLSPADLNLPDSAIQFRGQLVGKIGGQTGKVQWLGQPPQGGWRIEFSGLEDETTMGECEDQVFRTKAEAEEAWEMNVEHDGAADLGIKLADGRAIPTDDPWLDSDIHLILDDGQECWVTVRADFDDYIERFSNDWEFHSYENRLLYIGDPENENAYSDLCERLPLLAGDCRRSVTTPDRLRLDAITIG